VVKIVAQVAVSFRHLLLTWKLAPEEAITLFQEQFPDADLTSINLEESQSQVYYEIEGVENEKEFE